jgi:hypothetical protein
VTAGRLCMIKFDWRLAMLLIGQIVYKPEPQKRVTVVWSHSSKIVVMCQLLTEHIKGRAWPVPR